MARERDAIWDPAVTRQPHFDIDHSVILNREHLFLAFLPSVTTILLFIFAL